METLCLYCSALFVGKTPAVGRIQHHGTVGSILASAKHCPLCRTTQEHWSLGYLQSRFPELEGSGADSLPVKIEVKDAERGESEAVVWFVLAGKISVKRRQFNAEFSLTITRHVATGKEGALWTGKQPSFIQKCETIKSWYDECAETHSQCAPVQGEPPERLIEVGTEDRNPRLINTKAAGVSRTAYACLSHCWGDVRPMVALQGNLKQLQVAISFDTMPKTFREAILITRHLQIPYLWIDSLCIVQDDLDDWATEAAKMTETYSCSAVVISAMDGKNCCHGCFVDDDPVALDAKVLGPHVSRLSVRTLSNEEPLLLRVYEGTLELPTESHILRTRGWTLQEELLARREILCMWPELRWQCQHKRRTEAGHEFAVTNNLHSCTPLAQSRWLWCDWMSDYSQRSFTFQADRLSALVGVMQYYGKRTGHTHVLACWEETMIDDLLWLRGREIVDPLTAMSSIPSWSWITRATAVAFDFWGRDLNDDRIESDHARLVEARIQWAGQPMLSKLFSTKLVLEGPIQQMRLRVDPRSLDYNPPYIQVGDEEPIVSVEGGNPKPWRCAGQFDETAQWDDEMFTCLLMRSKRANVVKQKYKDYALRETFLILVEEPGEDNVFRRVGIAVNDSADTCFGEAKIQRIRLV